MCEEAESGCFVPLLSRNEFVCCIYISKILSPVLDLSLTWGTESIAESQCLDRPNSGMAGRYQLLLACARLVDIIRYEDNSYLGIVM